MTATAANVVITSGSAQVTIGLTSVEDNWTKKLTLITTPKTTAIQSMATGKNTTKALDLLLKAEVRITIDGYIATSLGTNKNESGVSITDVTDIKNTLKKIFFAGGVFTLNVHGTAYTVNSDKFSIKWVVDDTLSIDKYSVKATCIVAED